MTNTEIKVILQKILLRDEGRKVNNLTPSDILDIKDIIKHLDVDVVEECCDPITDGFYLGMTCPKCGKPFRQNIK